jgi:hypothetical protein
MLEPSRAIRFPREITERDVLCWSSALTRIVKPFCKFIRGD